MILTSFSHIDKAILNMRHGSICRAADSDCFFVSADRPSEAVSWRDLPFFKTLHIKMLHKHTEITLPKPRCVAAKPARHTSPVTSRNFLKGKIQFMCLKAMARGCSTRN
jgi:hypothetical protein